MPLTYYLSAPYSTSEGTSRFYWYGFSGTPSAVFDGIYSVPGGAASGSMYNTYQPYVLGRLEDASPLIIDARYAMVGDEVNVEVHIDVDLAVTTTGNDVQFYICQDSLHDQSNMVVGYMPDQAFTLTTPGESTVVNRTFTMDPDWNQEDLRIIVMVQSASKEILQTAVATANFQATVVVDCVPNGVEAGWTLTGPNDLTIQGSGDKTLQMFYPGDYTLTWDEITYWTSPTGNPYYQTVALDGIITFTGEYFDGPFASVTSGPWADLSNGQGVSLIDFDNDGLLDIHIINDGAADQLLRNEGDGTFSEIVDPLINDAGAGRSAAWADYNNDGNLDVFLGKYNEANVLMLGDGAGSFSLSNSYGTGDTGPAASVSWSDYNLDGNLDLYIVNNGGANILLQSMGDVGGGMYIFSPQAGEVANIGYGSAVAWGDADNDGRVDMYVTNTTSANIILGNTTFGFVDMTNQSTLGDLTNGVGAAWGDYDNDGDMDLYLTNDGMADVLWANVGNFYFNLVTGANLGNTGHGRGVHWVDIDNDGYLDLFITRHDQTDLFLIGDGAGNFERVPVGPDSALGNAVSCGDINGDGFVDLVVTREGQTNQLLINGCASSTDHNWLQVRLTGVQDNKTALGARVEITAAGMTQTRIITAGSGYLSMNALSADFGLGTATSVDLTITWPNGTVQNVADLGVNQVLNVTQGEDPVSPANDSIPSATALFGAIPNPFNPSTTIEFSLAANSATRLDVFTIDGRFVKTLVNETMAAGSHGAVWNGTDHTGRPVASGAYFYRLNTDSGFLETGRMVLVK